MTPVEYDVSKQSAIQQVQAVIDDARRIIEAYAGYGPRRRAVALTHLETAELYAVRAIEQGDS